MAMGIHIYRVDPFIIIRRFKLITYLYSYVCSIWCLKVVNRKPVMNVCIFHHRILIRWIHLSICLRHVTKSRILPKQLCHRIYFQNHSIFFAKEEPNQQRLHRHELGFEEWDDEMKRMHWKCHRCYLNLPIKFSPFWNLKNITLR